MSKAPKNQSTKKLAYSIIIPNLNGSALLKDCLTSLLQSINKTPQIIFEIILVDNASIDDSIDIFSQLTTNLHTSIILNPKNYGFAKAINIGITKAKYDYIIVCNNDIKFDSNWFKEITKAITTRPKYASYFGLVLNKDGSLIESTGLKYYWRGKAKNIGNGLPYTKELKNQSTSIPIWGASASLVVYKKNIIQRLGGFDENFFAYEEDVDLAFRLNKFGYKTLFIPKAISYHLGGATSGKMGNFRAKMDAKNWIFLIVKNYSLKQILKYFPQIVEERLRNFSGLCKQTIKIYNWQSIWILPISIFQVYGQVLLKLPKILVKRFNFIENYKLKILN